MHLVRGKRFGVGKVKRRHGRRRTVRDRPPRFFAELLLVAHHMEFDLTPFEMEEGAMRTILLSAQAVLENECDAAILATAKASASPRAFRLVEKLSEGYVSFPTKCEWLKDHGLIDKISYAILSDVRTLRNAHAHNQPSPRRRKFSYRGMPLMTAKALRSLLADCELALGQLITLSGRKRAVSLFPRSLAEILAWPQLNALQRPPVDATE
jgi:hypothetical protein